MRPVPPHFGQRGDWVFGEPRCTNCTIVIAPVPLQAGHLSSGLDSLWRIVGPFAWWRCVGSTSRTATPGRTNRSRPAPKNPACLAGRSINRRARSFHFLQHRAFENPAVRQERVGPASAKAERGNLQVEVFYATPTRLASILDGLGHQTSQQGGCTSVRPA